MSQAVRTAAVAAAAQAEPYAAEDTGVKRRSAPRVRLRTQVGLHSENNFFTGFSGDLSDGGLFVVTYEELGVGDRVAVELALPDGHDVHAEGHVVWTREPQHLDVDTAPGVGIAFDDISDADREAIGRFMQFREPTFVDHE